MAIKQLLHGLTHNGEGHARVLMTSILSKKKYKPLPARQIREDSHVLDTYFSFFFFFNERPRSLASPFGRFRFSLSYSLRARSNATSCDFASRPRPRPNDIYIYRSNSFGWKDGRLPATGEDTFVDVYLLRRGFRAKAAPTTAEGKLKKTLLPGNNGLRSRA